MQYLNVILDICAPTLIYMPYLFINQLHFTMLHLFYSTKSSTKSCISKVLWITPKYWVSRKLSTKCYQIKCWKIFHHMLALRLHDEFSFRIITGKDNSKQWGYHHFSKTFAEILSNKRNANGLFIFVWSWKWIFKDIILKMRNRCFVLLIFFYFFVCYWET